MEIPGPNARFDLSILPRPTKKYHTKPYERIALGNTGFNGKGKTVFISGGATGVGLAVSTAFAKAGVERLVIMSRSPGPLKEAKAALESQNPGLKVETYSASITDHARVRSILHEIQPIDIVVQSAGISHVWGPTPTGVDMAEMQAVFETNVLGPYNLLSTYISLPSAGRGKTFINISTASTHMRMTAQIGYGSSKTAFAQMVEHCALHESTKPAEERARLFSIHPGAFYTDMAKKHVAEGVMLWDDINLPADYCVWLAGPQSDFLHGRFVWPHWDLDEVIAMKDRLEKDPTYFTLTLVQ